MRSQQLRPGLALSLAASLAACPGGTIVRAGDHHHTKYRVVQGYVIQPAAAAAPVQFVSNQQPQVAGPSAQSTTSAVAPMAQPQALAPQSIAPMSVAPMSVAPMSVAPMSLVPAQTVQPMQMVQVAQVAPMQVAPAQTLQVAQVQLVMPQAVQVAQVQPVSLVPAQVMPAAANSSTLVPATFLLPRHCFGLFHR